MTNPLCWFKTMAAAALVCLSVLPALAVSPDEVLNDPALEARARHLSAGLRCLVCQNQSIDDSDAELAKDLRVLVRQRLVAGDTDRQVIDYLVSRYGEYVLLKPRWSWHTAILWLAAPAALAAGAGVVFVFLRRRKRQGAAAVAGLSAEEEARLAALLDGQLDGPLKGETPDLEKRG